MNALGEPQRLLLRALVCQMTTPLVAADRIRSLRSRVLDPTLHTHTHTEPLVWVVTARAAWPRAARNRCIVHGGNTSGCEIRSLHTGTRPQHTLQVAHPRRLTCTQTMRRGKKLCLELSSKFAVNIHSNVLSLHRTELNTCQQTNTFFLWPLNKWLPPPPIDPVVAGRKRASCPPQSTQRHVKNDR
jgi:hypothetical protein